MSKLCRTNVETTYSQTLSMSTSCSKNFGFAKLNVSNVSKLHAAYVIHCRLVSSNSGWKTLSHHKPPYLRMRCLHKLSIRLLSARPSKACGACSQLYTIGSALSSSVCHLRFPTSRQVACTPLTCSPLCSTNWSSTQRSVRPTIGPTNVSDEATSVSGR